MRNPNDSRRDHNTWMRHMASVGFTNVTWKGETSLRLLLTLFLSLAFLIYIYFAIFNLDANSITLIVNSEIKKLELELLLSFHLISTLASDFYFSLESHSFSTLLKNLQKMIQKGFLSHNSCFYIEGSNGSKEERKSCFCPLISYCIMTIATPCLPKFRST